jgi:hypothetical protein
MLKSAATNRMCKTWSGSARSRPKNRWRVDGNWSRRNRSAQTEFVSYAKEHSEHDKI